MVRARRHSHLEVLAMAEPKRTRLFILGFARPGIAPYILEGVKQAKDRKWIGLADWALIQKPEGGKATISTSKQADPGGARGAGVGGLAGGLLAVISGPIGVGAVVAGAAIGSVTAALKDSGLKDKDLESMSHLMAEGREGLVIAVPLDRADEFQEYMDSTDDFAAADRKLTVDIVPGRTLQDAIADYIAHEED
jgi:uncharacterized membrane protein